MPPRRLLLIGCSKTKLPTPGAIPAWERYDGMSYRVIKRALADGRAPENLDIRIVSAEFGLIAPEQYIPNYDRKMTLARALELAPEVAGAVRALLRAAVDGGAPYDEVVVVMGETYRAALPAAGTWPGPATPVELRGGIGVMLGALRQWLGQCALIDGRESPRPDGTQKPRVAARRPL